MLRKVSLFILLFCSQTIHFLYAQENEDSVIYKQVLKKYEQTKYEEEHSLEVLSDSLLKQYNLHLLQNETEERQLRIHRSLYLTFAVFIFLILSISFYLHHTKLQKKLNQEYKKLTKLVEKTKKFYSEIDLKEKEMIENINKEHQEKHREEYFAITIEKKLLNLLEQKVHIPPQEYFAQEMGMSTKQLRTYLQNTAWKSFNGLINKTRMEHVIEELNKNPDVNLSDLAKDLYISYNTLKINFKKYLDINISDFREIVKQEKKLNKEKGIF